ncbi:LPS biosynthesis glycosyltransferase [Oscillatoria sp. FACHB-1407]|uniref:LPS biosynthesis glycosyltransferase n=1 Tax=Oscillatoria sp. FACHB-1407 TaxID=2692847 RepID=UPI001685FB65|nr:LPS biosynthesis glycosyltransferase [Oscillatoria sp. FACHB-1407]MBD2460449.1 LPS biosynthesis glycosyltransferase [Oscillatoria sp. FACHB-1407]
MNTSPSTTHQTSSSNRLVDRLSQVIVVAYKESTDQLQNAIAQEGLRCEIQRQEDKPEYKEYAAAYRCMLNHCRAWERAAQETRPTMIVEADYVPVLGLGQLPLPFDHQNGKVGIAWLYTCAPQMYSVTPEGFIEGFSTALVAYILTPQGAACLTGLVDEMTQKHGTGYNVFDSYIDRYLRDRGFKNYIPFRNYGEHGGKSNPEHRKNGMSGIHRADVLYNKLAFTPAYVEDESLLLARLKARSKGLFRLGTGKFLRTKIVRTSSVPWRLMRTAIARQLVPRL